jgi:hypothetical protein
VWLKRVFVVSALAVASTAAVVNPAAAAATGAPSLSDFVLRAASNQADLNSRISGLNSIMPQQGVQDLLAGASRTGTRTTTAGAVCNPSAVDSLDPHLASAFTFCWDSSDNGASTGAVEWTPQGITTVADAQSDQLWGTAQPIIASWYDDDSEYVKGVRISFIDPHTSKYQHVLLVYPTSGSDYMSLRTEQTSAGTSLHAGGIAWYGNYLYVADSRRGFRVFDMRDIYDLSALGAKGNTSDKTQIGLHNGVYYAYGYRYVMPEVSAWTSNGGQLTDVSTCTGEGSSHFSFVGLDRSGTDHLDTGEYCNGSTAGRVATWPLAGSNGMPLLNSDGLWHATSAFRLSEPNVQGAVSNGNV